MSNLCHKCGKKHGQALCPNAKAWEKAVRRLELGRVKFERELQRVRTTSAKVYSMDWNFRVFAIHDTLVPAETKTFTLRPTETIKIERILIPSKYIDGIVVKNLHIGMKSQFLPDVHVPAQHFESDMPVAGVEFLALAAQASGRGTICPPGFLYDGSFFTPLTLDVWHPSQDVRLDVLNDGKEDKPVLIGLVGRVLS